MQRKNGFTLVEVLVVAAILLTIVALLWPAVSAARSAAKRSGEQVSPQPPQSWNLYTAQHDGHWFVKDTDGGVCHHPDCPCMSRRAESEAK